MKQIIKKGDIKRIIPKAGGGLTGEVHVLKYRKKKYILRRCETMEKAKHYVKVYHRFEKHNFLPKLIGRYGKDVVFEYLGRRHFLKNQPLRHYEQIGRIAGFINKARAHYDYRKVFLRQLRETRTAKYKIVTPKVLERRRRNNQDIRPKKVFSKKQAEKIKQAFNHLVKRCKPKTCLDANDYGKTNFIIKNDKVYFVDIEAIKPKVKGFGVGKAFMQMAKKKTQKDAFLKGYGSVSSTKFLIEEYMDFLYMSFLMQKIHWLSQIYNKKEYETPVRNLLKIVEKYSKH